MMQIKIFVVSAMVLMSSPVQAEDFRGVWFGGASLSDSKSAYGGIVVALPDSRLGEGLAVRGSINAGSYDYEADAQIIDGTYKGGEVALVYQTSGSWGWANFSAGPRITHTRLKPEAPANKRQGTRLDAGVQFDGALDSRNWQLTWLGSVGPFDQNFYSKVQIGRKISGDHTRIGIEGGFLGDSSFTQKNAGAFISVPFVAKSELQIGSGLVFQKGKAEVAYVSLGLSSVF